MLASLARNTAFSAVAFGINGLIGLAMVPVIVGAYGLAAFGLIVLSRTLLPGGALGLLDFGMSETATQTVGAARSTRDWSEASGKIGALLVLSAAVGLFAALGLALAAPALAGLLGAAEADHASFSAILQVSAISLLVLFPGLVAEGVVKGFERFGALRAIEVATTAGYAIATVASAAAGISYAAVAYAYLAALALRYVCLALIACTDMRRAGLRPARWTRGERRDVARRSILMFQSKVLGSLQMPVPPLLIGLLLGPSAVGAYDIVSRLPRFLKSTMSLLASAVLPVAARLEGIGAHAQMRDFGLKSFWLLPFVTFPVFFAAAGLSRPILEAWVGPQFSAYWPWLALMLAFPLAQVCLSVSRTLLLVRPDYLHASNKIAAGEIALQFALSLAFIKAFGAMSFVLGVAVASLAAWPIHLALIARSLHLAPAELWHPIAKHGLFAAAMGGLLAAWAQSMHPTSLALLVAAFVGGALVYWVAAYALLLEKSGRMLVGRLASSLISGARA